MVVLEHLTLPEWRAKPPTSTEAVLELLANSKCGLGTIGAAGVGVIRVRISRQAGPGFHVMPGHRFTRCRAGISPMPGHLFRPG
jgi:hypothetical protein